MKLETFRASKNLSIIATNFAVSLTLSPPTSLSALLTDSLKTCNYVHVRYTRVCIYTYVKNITCAARSTLILEKEVSWICSYLSFGNRARPDDLPESPS